MENELTKLHQFSGGEISLWMEPDEPICIKAVASSGDPVELNAHEARELGELLLRMADAAE